MTSCFEVKMKKTILFLFLILLSACSHQTEELYQIFKNPSAKAKPFVRWWWNGNQINEKELLRELDLLKDAGFGGVEINPIEMPPDAVKLDSKPLRWLSPEWNNLLKIACEGAQKRVMIADLIVGSGWPFGGKFLKPDEIIQRVTINSLDIKGPLSFRKKISDLIERIGEGYRKDEFKNASSNDLFFIRLVPENIKSITECLDLKNNIDHNGYLSFQVASSKYKLVWGTLQKGFRHVQHGALGADGPVMNHFDKNVTMAYLNRLKEIERDLGVKLHYLIRALFCDSIELAGANWTNDFAEEFFKRCGYELEPYFPFVFYPTGKGYEEWKHNADFGDSIKRVRYDYNKTLVELFLERFVTPFQQFCTDNKIKCRYQAYGSPWLVGISEGNLIPDIPESNNWLYSRGLKEKEYFTWNKYHGYMIWNKYAAAGGHLSGRKIISCESMTNTRGVFDASLETIKQADDMIFITGITHSVVHGFNYSPPEAGFPGRVRFGTYFNEQNPWWSYIKKWTDYNARLSSLFQNSDPVVDIAILSPTADIWSQHGLVRVPFHTRPWYCYELWESISQNGSSSDYINESIIQNASFENGKLNYGPMSYKAIIVTNVESIQPKTAIAINNYVQAGGKVIFVGKIPDRSLSLKNATKNDEIVRTNMDKAIQFNHQSSALINEPENHETLLNWPKDLLQKFDIKPNVQIKNPQPYLYQIHHKRENKDIFFFTNTHRKKSVQFECLFNTGDKIPWRWDAETGERFVFPYDKTTNQLNILLNPCESLLLIFEPRLNGKPTEYQFEINKNNFVEITNQWNVKLNHIDSNEYNKELPQLIDFSKSEDKTLNSFAGTVIYSTAFDNKEDFKILDLGEVKNGITEVSLNGKPLGTRWYGKHVYDVGESLIKGENKLEINYTTTLLNYCKSLTENQTAKRWTTQQQIKPCGLLGPVRLYTKN